MSLADLISLLSITLAVMNSAFFHDSLPSTLQSAHCKAPLIPPFSYPFQLTLFIVHTMTGFSTWCWLFVSALRYMAVYHPLWHISRWRLGQRSLITMLLLAIALNTWLLFAVVRYRSTCAESPLSTSLDINRYLTRCIRPCLTMLARLLHATDICYSYIAPVLITFALDLRVILSHPPGLASTIRIHKRRQRRAGWSAI
jgi:hypothetical protein